MHVVEVAGLIQAHGQSHDVAAAHAAVGVVAVAGDLLDLQQNAHVGLDGAVLVEVGELLPEQALVAEGQHTAHVGVTVFLGGHGEAVAVGEHLGGDLGDGLVGIALFIHLDEVAVLSPAGHVEDQGDVVLMSDAVDLADVAHGDGLAADGVVGDAGEDQGHVLGTDGLDQLLQLLNVHVALERVLLILAALGNLVQQFLVVQVAGDGAHLLDVALGGVEVAVGGDGEDLAGMTLGQDLLDDLHQDGLSGTALLDDEGVGALHLSGAAVEQATLVLAEIDLVHHLLNVAAVGADQVDDLLPVLLAATLENVAEGVQQDIVAGVAAIGLVTQEQGGPLLVGHGSGAGVRQHVDGQHSGGESELVPVSGVQGALTLLDGSLGQIAHDVSAMLRHRHIQGIVLHVLVHFDYLHKFGRILTPDFIGDTPVVEGRDSQLLLCAWRTVSFARVTGDLRVGLLDGDDLDLHEGILGEPCHFDRTAGGIAALSEEGCIHLVHGAEVVHVAEEHGGLDHGIHRQARCLEDGLHIGQGLLGLLLDPLGERARGRVNGELTGSDDQAAQIGGLAVRTDGGGGLGRTDDRLHRNTPPLIFSVR